MPGLQSKDEVSEETQRGKGTRMGGGGSGEHTGCFSPLVLSSDCGQRRALSFLGEINSEEDDPYSPGPQKQPPGCVCMLQTRVKPTPVEEGRPRLQQHAEWPHPGSGRALFSEAWPGREQGLQTKVASWHDGPQQAEAGSRLAGPLGKLPSARTHAGGLLCLTLGARSADAKFPGHGVSWAQLLMT